MKKFKDYINPARTTSRLLINIKDLNKTKEVLDKLGGITSPISWEDPLTKKGLYIITLPSIEKEGRIKLSSELNSAGIKHKYEKFDHDRIPHDVSTAQKTGKYE
jgi:hypothetical protein